MKFVKKIMAAILAAALLVAFCPAALAADMELSDQALEFIKQCEGYRQFAYADAGNWYIGYGVQCGEEEYPDGLTQAEATVLLEEKLVSYCQEVSDFAAAYKLTLTQNQFDALVSFTYNVGASWMKGGNRLFTYITTGYNNYTDLEIADAMSVWSHQSQTPVAGLVARRLNEAKIFLYGDYSGTGSVDFCYLIVDRNGGTLENDVFCYYKGQPYGSLPIPTLEGKYFAGWQTTDGSILTGSSLAQRSRAVTATWSDIPMVSFDDVKPGDWYYEAVTGCVGKGLMNGISDGVFSPNQKMSRAMLVTVLWRMAGSPAVDYNIKFTDVAPGQWYTAAIRWAASTGIVTGYTELDFGTSDSVTREQLAVILYRFAAMQGRDVTVQDEMGLAGYSDASNIAQYAYTAVLWAKLSGIIAGTTDSTLSPKSDATRAQVAKMLMSYMG